MKRKVFVSLLLIAVLGLTGCSTAMRQAGLTHKEQNALGGSLGGAAVSMITGIEYIVPFTILGGLGAYYFTDDDCTYRSHTEDLDYRDATYQADRGKASVSCKYGVSGVRPPVNSPKVLK